jgi:hypothetical protein
MKPNPRPSNRLEAQLQADLPRDALPDNLHASIMTAVRTSARPAETRRLTLLWPGLLALTAVLALALALVWLSNPPASRPRSAEIQPLAAAAVTLREGQQLTERAPAAVLAPLTQEMEFLNRDVRSAVAFLVASVP